MGASDRRVGEPLEHQSLDLHATARRAGSAQWLDARLFEILGGWVASVPEPEVKITFATHAAHHGWHASLWVSRLPTLHEVDPASWARPASARVEEAVEVIAGATGTLERLVGVHRVLLPRLSAAHTEHLEAASPMADGPTSRTLRLVLSDEAPDQLVGERLLQRLIVSRADASRAAAHQAAVEGLLVEAGPLLASPSPTPLFAAPLDRLGSVGPRRAGPNPGSDASN